MHLRNSERLQERVHIDLEAGMIIKIVVACLGVGGVIFYLGLTLGQGDAIARIHGVSEPDGLKQLEGSLRVLTPASDLVADGSLLLFPTLLSRRADQRIDQDELAHTLRQFRSKNLADQEVELSQFSDEVLRERFGLALDPVTGETVKVDPGAKKSDEAPIPGGAVGAPPTRTAEAGERIDPEDNVEIEIVVAPASAREEEPKEVVVERHTIGKYTLQLQSFRDPDEARIFVVLMEERGYHPFVQRVELGDKGMWHRVRVGRFMKMKDAQKFKSKFEQEQGFSTRVMSL
ncbi:MAG: SPOR domain-containing protein [Pseudomonadota bacterium]